ncbi:2OG-Fe dioxygenase family protein [Vibrio sp. CB1-14]|uniref:2OG-Fe dioxygenase family protein n=1 Tax=Vibrio chaetopteri TaxID=3016528 RepID=A0AAU8BU49_9VIBR
MNTLIAPHSTRITNELGSNTYAYEKGQMLREALFIDDQDIAEFASHWHQLKIDKYMNDGGRYRYRRYSQLIKLRHSNELVLLPHEPYQQSMSVNSLNGGTLRYFEPMTDDFLTSPCLERLLVFLAYCFDDILGEANDWNIKLHPYRILANDEAGQPTPEGLHRDGVTFISSLLIARHNIRGGTTTITDNQCKKLEEITMTDAWDIIIANDAQSMHQVSEITRENVEFDAYRDVLVIAFTKIEDK